MFSRVVRSCGGGFGGGVTGLSFSLSLWCSDLGFLDGGGLVECGAGAGGAGGGDAKGSKGRSNERDDGKESTEGLVQQHSDDQGLETSDKPGKVNRCACAYSESQAQADEDRESSSVLRDLRCTGKSALICAGGIEQGESMPEPLWRPAEDNASIVPGPRTQHMILARRSSSSPPARGGPVP